MCHLTSQIPPRVMLGWAGLGWAGLGWDMMLGITDCETRDCAGGIQRGLTQHHTFANTGPWFRTANYIYLTLLQSNAVV